MTQGRRKKIPQIDSCSPFVRRCCRVIIITLRLPTVMEDGAYYISLFEMKSPSAYLRSRLCRLCRGKALAACHVALLRNKDSFSLFFSGEIAD